MKLRSFFLVWIVFSAVFPGCLSAETVTVEDFEGKEFKWETRRPMLKGRPEYTVADEKGNRYLHAAPLPGREGNAAYKKFTVDLKKTPLFHWRWRVEKFPASPTEGNGAPNDTAASVYVYFQSGLSRRIIKYVWCFSHPRKEWFTSPGSGPFIKTRVFTLRSGPPVSQWAEETVDLEKDYTAAFGGAPPAKALGIGVLTDGDQTKSESVGDYDGFTVSSRD